MWITYAPRMKLTFRGEYALRALVVLGLNYGNSVMPIQAISKLQNIPKRFLEQILHDLKSAGILESKRGIAGGYRLKMPPDRITLAQLCERVKKLQGPQANPLDYVI